MLITDKFRNRIECCSVVEIEQPAFYHIYSESDLNDVKCNYPVIVKPTGKGGKKGITVVETEDKLMDAYFYAKDNSGDSPVIIEQFISGGQEYSVESLSYKGKHYIIQITEKISSGAPHCVELGHHQPAAISDAIKKKIETAIIKGLVAIGVDNTTCHTEIKIVDQGALSISGKVRNIGWGAYIGARCLITRDVPESVIFSGNPGSVLRNTK